MEERIREVVAESLAALGAGEVAFAVERPGDASHGDYAVNAAMATAKALGKNPREVAEALVSSLTQALGDAAAHISVAGPGFINITLSKAAVRRAIDEAIEAGERYGFGSERAGSRVIVEYSCPNPFKEMHIGHLMSTVIGEAVARLVETSGAHTARDSYGGDVGPHVAKALWALRTSGATDVASAVEVDTAYAKGSRAYEASKDAKQEIDKLSVAIYEGKDQELMDLWQKAREVCLAAFRELYVVLGTTFDYYFFESETAETGLQKVREHIADGVFEESDGAVIYRGEKKGLHTLVFITSRGTPTYEAKEIGLAFLKEERWPSDHSYILTAAEQTGHFAVVKAALEDIAPELGRKTEHVPHGFLRLTTGKMSSREGNTITARELIASLIEAAQEKNKDPLVAEQVAVGAIKYAILRQTAGSDIIFDPEKSLALEGDSGPYLQYALVRAKKLLTYEGGGGTTEPDEPFAIERLLLHFPAVAARARRELRPHHVAQYLTELAGEWNAFYASEQVLGSADEAYKLKIAKAFANTMTSGLFMLGIPTPEKM